MKSILILIAFIAATQAFSMPTLSWKAPKSTALGVEETKEKSKKQKIKKEKQHPRETNEARRENGTINRSK